MASPEIDLENLIDTTIEMLVTHVAMGRVESALAGVASGTKPKKETGPEFPIPLLQLRVKAILSASRLAAAYSETELLEMRSSLWASVARHAEALERGFGDGYRLRLLRRQMRSLDEMLAANPTEWPKDKRRAAIASHFNLGNESVARRHLDSKPPGPKNRIALEDVERRVLKPRPKRA